MRPAKNAARLGILLLWPAIGVAQATEPQAGSLRVQISEPGSIRSVEVQCPRGYRTRVSLVRGPAGVTGTASIPDLPAEACTLFFKGGPPATWRPVQGGQSLLCDVVGTTAVCSDADEAAPTSAPPTRPFRDQLIVRLSETGGSTSVSVACPGGYRRWSAVTQGLATLDGLPREACTLQFQGRSSATYQPVRGGMHLTCRVHSTAAACSVDHDLAATPDAPVKPQVAHPGGGKLRVAVDESLPASSVELLCPGGFRARLPLRTGPAQFTAVPEGPCRLQFQGPIPAAFHPVEGGQVLACQWVHNTTLCDNLVDPDQAPANGSQSR